MTPWQMDSLYYCLYFDDFPKKGGISLMASKTDAIKSSCPAVGTALHCDRWDTSENHPQNISQKGFLTSLATIFVNMIRGER